MAIKVANGTGNFSSATVWDSAVNTPTIHATTNLSNVVLGRFTATFTAPNTTNACTGCLVYYATAPGGNPTVTLQQSTVDTAATVTINTSLITQAGWVYFRFPTPFVYTTTAAGAYRFKVSSTSTSGTLAADSGATLPAYIGTDDRLGALGASDDIWVVTHNNATPPVITVDGTRTVGSGTNVTAISSTASRAVDQAVNIYNTGAILKMDTTASSQLTLTGNILTQNGGDFQAGTVASPLSSSYTANVIIANTVDARWGIANLPFGVGPTMAGATPPSLASTYVSGTGIAADPLITAADIGVVGDQVGIAATTVAQTPESRYIITKNSATSYVLSATSGGAEAALVNTHAAGAHIVNMQRNVIIKPSNPSFGYFINNYANSTMTLKAVRAEYTAALSNAILVSASANNTATAVLDYFVGYLARSTCLSIAVSKTTASYTGIVLFSQGTTNNVALNIATNANNKTFTDTYIMGSKRSAFSVAAFNITFNRLYLSGNNTDNNAAAYGATLGVGQISITNSRIYANGNAGLLLQGVTDSSIVNSTGGVLGVNNNVFLTVLSDTYNTAVISNTTIGDATLLANYANMIPGSNVAFENMNGTAYNNVAYTENGKLNATGAGLTDTTVRSGTSGEHSVRLDSETTTGRSTTFDVVATPNETVLVTGYIWENASFVADGSASVVAELYLPGLIVGVDTPSATKTMTKTTVSSSTDAAFTLSAFYSGITYDVATVRIKAITTTAGAYAYIGSINQGGNPATKYNIWRDGRPIDFMPEAIGDAQTIAAATWNYLLSQATTAGTFGNQVGKKLSTKAVPKY